MRKHTIFFSLAFLLVQSAQADGNPFIANQPVGVISKGTKLTLAPADPNVNYISTANTAATTSGFTDINNSSVRRVVYIDNPTNDGAQTELQGVVKNGTLLMQKEDFAAEDASCYTTGTCTLKNNTVAYQSGSFNFFDWLKDIFGFGSKPASLVTPAEKTSPSVASKMAISGIENANRQILNDANQKSCDTLPTAQQNDPRFQCGFKMALAAFQKAKEQGKTTSDTFIFNDFGKGELQGKMYFFNSSGNMVNLVDKNPIPVIRGQGDGENGGFGNVGGHNGTPDGAMVTAPYTGKRGGNIKDGIELDGLEPSNKNLRSRKILMHGWDTYTSPGTAGCLGVDGTITLNGRMGGLPAGVTRSTNTPYLDMMKERLLRGNKVFIYNFTPNKVREGLCR
jgi:hypothetical protein